MNDYATWDELMAATVRAEPEPIPLAAVIYPPRKREKYIAMRIMGVGWTDTRNYRWGRNKQARSEAYGRRMVTDYLACHYDLPIEIVRDHGPDIRFHWSAISAEFALWLESRDGV